jgi:uncharacterized protein YabE (DUF348 family)
VSAEVPSPRRDVVIAATVIITAVIVAVTLVILADKPTSAIVLIVVPLVMAVLVFFGARIQAGQQQIQTQVNGNQSAQLAATMELARLLAAAQPVAPLIEVAAAAPIPTAEEIP